MITIKNEVSNTHDAVEFYERYKEAFGEVIHAEMISNSIKVKYVLTLTNKNNEKLIFDGGLTTGYGGAGCIGTQKVLNLAGFDVSNEFISKNKSFKLTK